MSQQHITTQIFTEPRGSNFLGYALPPIGHGLASYVMNLMEKICQGYWKLVIWSTPVLASTMTILWPFFRGAWLFPCTLMKVEPHTEEWFPGSSQPLLLMSISTKDATKKKPTSIFYITKKSAQPINTTPGKLWIRCLFYTLSSGFRVLCCCIRRGLSFHIFLATSKGCVF